MKKSTMWNSTFCLILSALLTSLSLQTSATAIPTNSSQDVSPTKMKEIATDGLFESQVHPLPATDEDQETEETSTSVSTTTANPALRNDDTTTTAAVETAATARTMTVSVPHPNRNSVPVTLGGFTPSVEYNGQSTSASQHQARARILQRRRASIQYPGMIRKFDTSGNANINSNAGAGKLNEQSLSLPFPQEVNHNLHGAELVKENIPAVNTFFDSVRFQNHGLGHAQGLPEQSGEKGRLYYGDMNVPGRPAQSASSDVKDNANGEGVAPAGHISLHAHAHSGLGHQNYYYPENFLGKQPLTPLYKAHSHSHHPAGGIHHGHGHGHDLTHYAPQAHHHSSLEGSHHAHVHNNAGHQAYGGHQLDEYRGQGGHGNQIGPVIGKALQLLIPSALFLTGASALFPNRVHVPTNDNDVNKQNERVKRSARSPRNSFDDGNRYPVPSAFLRREHRGDDYGPELYPEDHEDYFDESASSNFGERSAPNATSTIRTSEPQNEIPSTGSAEEAELVFPDFKPMPALPILRINPAESVSKDVNSQADKNSNESVEEAELIDNSTIVNANSTTKVVSNVTHPTPQEVMSKLLIATLHPTPSAVTYSSSSPSPTTMERRASDGTTSMRTTFRSTLPTTVRSAVFTSTRNGRVEDSFKESRDKPFFRQMSTEQPNRIIITPESKTTTTAYTTVKNGRGMATTPGGRIVGRRAYGKRAGSAENSFESSRSRIRTRGSGPNIIELGGETERVTGKTIYNGARGKDIPVVGKPSSIRKGNKASHQKGNSTGLIQDDDLDLSPDSPVVGLITNFAARDQDSPQCQKRALCELAVRGSLESATKFEKFLWNLASLVPASLSMYYDLQDTFGAVVGKKCNVFKCARPNLDLQES